MTEALVDPTPPRSYKAYPWPRGRPSILATVAEEGRRQANFWLDAELGDDDSDSDYFPSESSETDLTSDSDQETSTSSSDEDISESEVAYVRADALTGQWSSPTPSLKELEEEEELAREIAELVKAEQDTAAAYNPDEVVSLITQFYELLITMGHWPEGSLRYSPHTDPPVNEALAVQLGYAPATIALMRRLPYLDRKFNGNRYEIIARTQFADYTREKCLREGRHPYPYGYNSDYPNIDPWLLPLTLPNRDGWHVMLDTRLGSVRAYCAEGLAGDTVEWRRYGDSHPWTEETICTEYRRATLVPAARYFSELIYAYRSLSRVPIMNPDESDPKNQYRCNNDMWLASEEREIQQMLLMLYRECGWPDDWRRAEFVEKSQAQIQQIKARRRAVNNDECK
ncbi:hypothetical protein K438DRAFT_1807599 [Mycena galopus ATCC 62051]|nr:hypothetical protein K438DRAFT_1807599 [Mycena galopus ATCC 62051]